MGRKGAQNTSQSTAQYASRIVNITCAACDACVNCQGLQCKVCKLFFHHSCENISDDNFTKFIPLTPFINWICSDCISIAIEMRADLQKLQSSNDKHEAQIAALTAKLADLEKRMMPIVNAAPYQKSCSPAMPVHHITVMLSSSINKVHKFNFVVVGLAEDNTQDDLNKIQNLLQDCLKLQPFITGCRRLGKSTPGRNRKLLVTFKNVSARDDVLALAKQMKPSSLPSAQNVYINLDWSRKEARAAYEARTARRQQQALSHATDEPETFSSPLTLNLPPLDNCSSMTSVMLSPGSSTPSYSSVDAGVPMPVPEPKNARLPIQLA